MPPFKVNDEDLRHRQGQGIEQRVHEIGINFFLILNAPLTQFAVAGPGFLIIALALVFTLLARTAHPCFIAA